MALIDKFESFLTHVPATGCMEWSRCRNQNRYGQVRVDGRARLAHRVAYRRAFGEIPEGMLVLHKCDNPPCCNPAHLFLGSAHDNTHDMLAKGRSNRAGLDLGRDWARTPRKMPSGDAHPMRRNPGAAVRGSRVFGAKLSEAQVAEIRARRASGTGTKALCVEFGLSKTSMKALLSRRTWKHVA